MDIPKLPFTSKKSKTHFNIELVHTSNFADWKKQQNKTVQEQIKLIGYKGVAGTIFVNDKTITLSIEKEVKRYNIAKGIQGIRSFFSCDTLKNSTFSIAGKNLKQSDYTQAAIGWGLAWYRFDTYKSKDSAPALVMPAKADKKRVEAILNSTYLLRNMINTPANDCTPATLEKVARKMAKEFQATLSVTADKNLEKEFPLIHTVGKAAEDKPRLLDLQWGNTKDPALTIVGKGVTFDTGGLNIKPTSAMALMKKDMGGAAHALALGRIVMSLELPVRLRILVPTVENSIAGNAFRPGDIIKSRSGLTVENTNTDAEGRLILADALTYACENKPELLIDFATLTGSARAALGPDIPAAFTTQGKTGETLQKLALTNDDPVWIMPLWEPYKSHIESNNADLMNSANIHGDLIYSALFLKQFVNDNTDWIHLDCFAWSLSDKPGRPKGGADTGLMATLALIEDRYAQ